MSDEENEVFTGSVTSQPQMVNVQTSAPMYMVERSSAPQVIGILVIVYYILSTLMGLIGFLSLDFISDLDETGQVEALNKLVTDYSVPQICGEAEGYIKYKNDVSTLPTPLSHGVSTYSNNILELKKFF